LAVTNEQAVERRYLLGTLADDERRLFEEMYFQDDNAFAEIEFAEDDLVDAFVRKQLAADDHERFERIVENSPRLLSRVEFARMLRQRSVSQAQVTANTSSEAGWSRSRLKSYFVFQPVFQFALAGMAVLFLTASLILGLNWWRLRWESRQLVAERSTLETQKQELAQQLASQKTRTDQLDAEMQNARKTNEQLNQELQETKDQLSNTQSTFPVAPAFTLMPSGIRGGDSPELVLSSRAREIQLRLALENDDYASYQVTIKSPGGVPWSRSNLRAAGRRSARVVSVRVPSSKLPQGEYNVTVSGRSPTGDNQFVASYPFRVKK
jgi:hypothetical protein